MSCVDCRPKISTCFQQKDWNFIPSGKTDRGNRSRRVKVPPNKRLCPVVAYEVWRNASGLIEGALFRSIDRWGHIVQQALTANSLSRLLRQAFIRSGVDPAS